MPADELLHDDDGLDENDFDDDGDQPARITVKQLRALRRSANRATKLEKENTSLRSRVAVADAGLGHLNPVQQRMLLAAVDEPTPEALKTAADAAGWGTAGVSPEGDEEAGADAAAHTAAEQTVTGAGSARPNQLTPEEVNGWAADRLYRLNQAHPELMEAVCRGEPITLPDGF